jgi:alpha-D-ribose 1-methylphosphonate 5-triphosphate synthase subunit PhnH
MIGTGFDQPVFQAQSAFRAILDALARPGTVQGLGSVHAPGETVDAPAPLSAGAAAVALALCDHDTPVWLDGGLRRNDEVAQWLRFHCGCPLVENPRDAAFAFASDIETLPPFETFGLGTAEYPDRSTTIVLQVESFERGTSLALEGPGIRGRTPFCAGPLPQDIAARLAANRTLFPRGVDLVLATATAVLGLPRSVRIVGD